MTGTVVNTRRPTGRVVVIRVCGDVEGAGIARLRSALLGALLRGASQRVVLDLQAADRLAAEAIGAVVAADQIAADRGLAMVVRRPRPPVAQQLREAGLPRARIQTRSQLPNSHFVFWLV